ncbi:MAG: hypothetical protein PHW04_11220 [Candidatus Wallbacteria bacterium]|nr:hypothetical protein [Candidatus Wallbacteria bacterium]
MLTKAALAFTALSVLVIYGCTGGNSATALYPAADFSVETNSAAGILHPDTIEATVAKLPDASFTFYSRTSLPGKLIQAKWNYFSGATNINLALGLPAGGLSSNLNYTIPGNSYKSPSTLTISCFTPGILAKMVNLTTTTADDVDPVKVVFVFSMSDNLDRYAAPAECNVFLTTAVK